MKWKVVIIDNREEGFELEEKAFALEDVKLIICPSMNEDELIEIVKDASVVIFTSSQINEKVINHLENCKLLIRYGVGLDNVDLKAASGKGIYVCNTPNYGTYAVAEHAFALLMCLNSKLAILDHNVRSHIWDMESIQPIHSLRYKTLGIVGFGNIGRYMCNMALAFDMKVVIYDPYINEDSANKYKGIKVSFDDLVDISDHISLHTPLTEETKHLFNKNVFQKMKSRSTIINTSRGGLINQLDLISALKSERISGAALDVFENEPLDLNNELLTLRNVVLTPHVAWYTEESIVNLHQEVINDVIRVLNGTPPQNAVNKINNFK
jgi:D-3-phosphoglycerate dehydrogenase / 2-oxoglutarate reductase